MIQNILNFGKKFMKIGFHQKQIRIRNEIKLMLIHNYQTQTDLLKISKLTNFLIYFINRSATIETKHKIKEKPCSIIFLKLLSLSPPKQFFFQVFA